MYYRSFDDSKNLIVRSLFVIFCVYISTKIITWFIRYLKRLHHINKIPGILPMLPFIGNAHQLKPGAGIKY